MTAAREDRHAIVVKGLHKSFGAVRALNGIDLTVRSGTVFGLLGPNGAGKTTLVRVLTTLLRPDGGEARVAGYDVLQEAGKLRSVIGLAGQYAAIDESLTGRENLEMVGRLYHLDGGEARRRADLLLDQFGLSDSAHRRAKTYSGGMRRRLDLAASLVARPQVLFLDEPTTGLDPPARIALWEVIQALAHDNTTVLLTTQHMEEADHLADRIAVIDRGRVIAEGTPAELKGRVGGQVLWMQLGDRSQVADAAEVIASFSSEAPQLSVETGQVSLSMPAGASMLTEIVRRLDAAGMTVSEMALRQPTLDDVFLALTGRVAEEAAESGDGAAADTRKSDHRGRST